MLSRTSSRLGDQGSAELSASADDRTHFSRKGAQAMAGLVAGALPAAVSALKPHPKNTVPTAKNLSQD